MNWWIVLLSIWGLGCVYMYWNHNDKIDAVKKEDPDGPQVLYDIIGIVILLAWPLMVPGTIKIIIKEVRRRRGKV